MSQMSHRTRLLVVGGLLAAVAVAALVLGLSRGGGDAGSPGQAATRTSAVSVPPGMSTVRAGQLPPEAQQTLRLIDAGGPFPYRQDGTVFGNREGRLPKQKNGYYREYTVDTPGSADRGARRIIAGSPGERYYTSDHYATFRVIVP